MLFNSLNKKLKKSYGVINPELGKMVFPNGEAEYIYVGTILNNLFKNNNVFDLIKIYASVYTYYKSTLGNTYKTFIYAKKQANHILSDGEIKELIALVMFNLTSTKIDVDNPVDAVYHYRRFVESHLQTVAKIQKYEWQFKTNTVDAGTQNSPLLVNGADGVRDYITSLNIPGIESISYKPTSTLHQTDEIHEINYAIDEYTLYNAKDSSEIARLWFNIYGTENAKIQPSCLSDKVPFSASQVAPKLFSIAVKECNAIEEICQSNKIDYNYNNLVLSSLNYFYQIWLVNFKNLRLGQSEDLKDEYITCFINYNKEAFANSSYSQVMENEKNFPDMIKKLYYRIRSSYEKNNFVFIDDGLTEEFLMEFVSDKNDIEKIKPIIYKKLMNDWVSLGEEADHHYLT